MPQRKQINWVEVQKYYDDNHTTRECIQHFSMSSKTIDIASKNGKFKSRSPREARTLSKKLGKQTKPTWSEERRKKFSEDKTEFYKLNPDKHPNKILSHNKSQMSYPEKMAYCFFEDNEINFEHSYKIGNYYADFYLIDRNEIIEVDGEYFHKDRKEKDAIRDKFMQGLGYKVTRFPAKEIISRLNLYLDKEYSISKEDSKNRIFIFKSKPASVCLICTKPIGKNKYKKCRNCYVKYQLHDAQYRKVKNRPSKEELESLINTENYTNIGKKIQC